MIIYLDHYYFIDPTIDFNFKFILLALSQFSIGFALYVVALCLGITALFSYWVKAPSSDVNNIYTISELGLDTAHLSVSGLLPQNFRKLVSGSSSSGYIDLNHENTRNLFRLLGDPKYDNHANLLKASKTMLILGLITTCGSAIVSLQTSRITYHKAWSIVPLISSIASLVFGILSLSFFGSIHNSIKHSSLYDAKFSTGFTCALLFTIFSALPLITSLIDIALPNRLRNMDIYSTSSLLNRVNAATGIHVPTTAAEAKTIIKDMTAGHTPTKDYVSDKGISNRRGTGEPHNINMEVQHAE